MLLRVIALDYDGTIATDGIIHPAVHKAIITARSNGLLVVIVTGRILRELRRVAGDLSFVDGVVAENGAVILLSNGHRRLLGPPPFPVLLNELSSRGIEFVVGRCLVEMDAEHARSVLSVIQQKNLPLIISFNRNRMMVLPQSISKSSGLREILDILGTSIHNTIGIGDAENDYELLKSCEYGIAVEWASDFLKSQADFVLPGKGPEAVAEYINNVASETRIPVGFKRHRNLVLESKKGQASFEIAIRGRNILIAGDSNSGKSWVAGLFCEQLILQRYTLIVIDPEGDYGSLASLPNTLLLGDGKKLMPELADLQLLFHQGVSLILNLSFLEHDEKVAYIRQLLPMAAKYRRQRGYPHSILLDECHYFLDDSQNESLLDPELGSYILVTYQPSKLSQQVMQSFEAIVATRMVEKNEIDAIRTIAASESSEDWYGVLGNLQTSEAALLPPTEEAQGRLCRFSIVPRLTLHVRHRRKYYDRCVHPGQAFIFTDNGRPIGQPVSALSELAGSAAEIAAGIIYCHLQRHDFSNWILRVFYDQTLANQVRRLELEHARSGTAANFGAELAAAIESRYKEKSQ